MKLYLLPACLLFVFLASCSYQKLEFEKESGKVNKVKVGEKFCISLPEDHKTNYYWTITHDYNLRYISYIASVFHGTTVEFNFEAVRKGKTDITLHLSGYNEVKETKKFPVKVE